MASKVYATEEVELFSGKKIALRPLKISVLRKFMKEFDNMTDTDVLSDNGKSLDVLMDCVQIAFLQFAPDLAEDREALEDELDIKTIYKIIEVGAGIKLDNDDPNPQAAVQDGTN